MKQHKKQKSKWHELIESILIALVIALVIRAYVVQAFKIPTGSMQPTLHGAHDYGTGDKILVNKFLYSWIRQPERGDIIVFTTKDIPGLYTKPRQTYLRKAFNLFGFDGSKDFIKRLIALPGDKVEIRNGDIYINDQLLDKPPVLDSIDYLNTGSFGKKGKVITIPENYYYVLGDNSGNSKDSRYWGFVPKDNIKGKAFCIYWPPSRIGGIE